MKCYPHAQMEEGELLLERTLFTNQLPDDFTQQVMASLEGIEIEQPSVNEQSLRNQRIQGRRWITSRPVLWVASFLIVATAMTVYANPSIADWVVRSMFNQVESDPGLTKAKNLGIVQDPHIKIVDKGYTMEINEVVADAARLVIGVKVTDSKGNPVDGLIDWGGITIKDTSGKQVASLSNIFANSGVVQKLTFVFPQEVQTDSLIVEGKINQIGHEFAKPIVKGNWNFSFPLDMREANKLSVTAAQEQEYTTPDGLQVKLEKLVRTPSGVRIELTTSLNEEAVKRTPAELVIRQNLMFHFENEQGKEISRVNGGIVPHSSPKGGYKDDLISSTQVPGEKSGQVHWSFMFNYLPYEQEPVKFVLDGYSMPIISNGAVKFKPSELAAKPAVFQDRGDELKITGMRIGPYPNYKKTKEAGIVGAIYVHGTYQNLFKSDQWILIDEKGQEYPMERRGSYSDGTFGRANEGFSGFIVIGMTTLPKEATLVRKITDKWYSNVNWSFNLNGDSK